jgi:hypothetical protein
MDDRPGADVLSGTAQAWDSVRRVREPVAWALLVLAAVMVLVSAGQLFNLAGLGLPVCGGPATGSSCFVARASGVLPQFVDWTVIAPPVLSVILVAFSGGPTKRARQVLTAAAAVQAATLVLGAVCLAAVTAGTSFQPGSSLIFDAAGLAITATALIFTTAVLASPAVRPPAPPAPRHRTYGHDH